MLLCRRPPEAASGFCFCSRVCLTNGRLMPAGAAFRVILAISAVRCHRFKSFYDKALR